MPESKPSTVAEVRFYQLQKLQVDDALPLLLEKVLAMKKRCVVALPDNARVTQLSKHLWGYADRGFLPHGTDKDGNAEQQPIWLADNDGNPNGADILFALDMFCPTDWQAYPLSCVMFSKRDQQALAQARNWWRELHEKNANDLLYYQQDDAGRWKCEHTHRVTSDEAGSSHS